MSKFRLISPSTWFSSSDKVETKSVNGTVLNSLDGIQIFDSFETFASARTASSAMMLYRDSSAVSYPVNYIAEAFASINPVLKHNHEIVVDHPVLDLLQVPSPHFTQDLFLETLGKNYLITGDTFLIGLGNINRPPIELQPINSDHISSNEGVDGSISAFMVTGQTLAGSYIPRLRKREIRYYDPHNVFRELKQIRRFSSRNNSLLRGESPLLAAATEIRQHIAGNIHNIGMLDNGGKLSLLFHFDQNMDDDDFEATRDRVNQQYGGPSNAGKIGVTAGGKLNVEELGTNNKDMDFAKLQEVAKVAVAMQYKFPLPLLNLDAMTLSNYKEAREALFDDAVLPLADRIFGGLTDFLLPRFGLDPTQYRLTYNQDQITALQGRRNQELKLRHELNLETTNEMRAMIGREPIDDGDTLMVSATQVPLGKDLFTADNVPSRRLARDTEL